MPWCGWDYGFCKGANKCGGNFGGFKMKGGHAARIQQHHKKITLGRLLNGHPKERQLTQSGYG